jgi:hypothetical protein
MSNEFRPRTLRRDARPLRKVSRRIKDDGSEIDVLECGHRVFAKWTGRGFDAPDRRRCSACQYSAKAEGKA